MDEYKEYIGRQDAIDAVREAVIRGYGTDYGVIDSDVVYEVLSDVTGKDVLPCSVEKDGTLIVTVPEGTEIKRVLVQEEGTQWRCLFYAD